MLRILKLLPVLILLSIAPLTAWAHELIEQELFIRLVPEDHRLEGQSVMSFDNVPAGWPVEFLLTERADVEAVTTDGKPVPFKFDRGLLQIKPKDSPSVVTINYRIRFDDPVPQDYVGIEDPSMGVTATIMPEGAFLSAASGWHPLPVGVNCRFRVTVAGPSGLCGVTDGQLIALESGESGTWTTWQTPETQSALALAAGYYQVARDDLGGIQLLVFTSAENAALAPGYLESCRQYLELYQKLFGPYPYSKFAVVENFYPTGYGMPGWTLLGSSVIRLPFIRTTSLPHEIAHTWWGNAIKVDYRSGNWAEGLATYVADYYLKELHDPAEALEYRRKILRDYAALIDVGDDLPLSAFRSRMTRRDQAVGYGKAAMIFHMLRQRIGDETFWSGLRAAARQGLGKRYAWSDLQQHFETASGMDLATFFQQWIERLGAPQLELAEVSVTPVDVGWQVSGTLLQNEPAYDLAVPLRLETATQKHDKTLALVGRRNGFVFSVPERPLSLSVDSESILFRKLYQEELPATVNDLRASRVPLVVVANGSEALLDAAGDLLLGLQWQQAPVMSEANYLVQRPTGRDLLVLGWPANQILRPELPKGLTVAARQFEIGDQLYAGEQDVLFLVTTGHERRRVTAYLLPGSPSAARDAARRIPHYGRYSYLAFRDGRNQVKSTWEPASSPLKIFFNEGSVP